MKIFHSALFTANDREFTPSGQEELNTFKKYMKGG
jgi:hypothetical protein